MELLLAAMDQNAETPSWIPIVAFAIPALMVPAVVVPALRQRIGPAWKVPYGPRPGDEPRKPD